MRVPARFVFNFICLRAIFTVRGPTPKIFSTIDEFAVNLNCSEVIRAAVPYSQDCFHLYGKASKPQYLLEDFAWETCVSRVNNGNQPIEYLLRFRRAKQAILAESRDKMRRNKRRKKAQRQQEVAEATAEREVEVRKQQQEEAEKEAVQKLLKRRRDEATAAAAAAAAAENRPPPEQSPPPQTENLSSIVNENAADYSSSQAPPAYSETAADATGEEASPYVSREEVCTCRCHMPDCPPPPKVVCPQACPQVCPPCPPLPNISQILRNLPLCPATARDKKRCDLCDCPPGTEGKRTVMKKKGKRLEVSGPVHLMTPPDATEQPPTTSPPPPPQEHEEEEEESLLLAGWPRDLSLGEETSTERDTRRRIVTPSEEEDILLCPPPPEEKEDLRRAARNALAGTESLTRKYVSSRKNCREDDVEAGTSMEMKSRGKTRLRRNRSCSLDRADVLSQSEVIRRDLAEILAILEQSDRRTAECLANLAQKKKKWWHNIMTPGGVVLVVLGLFGIVFGVYGGKQ